MRITLGSVQLGIMRVLWSQGEASARDITDAMSRTKPIAHSTVQTLLRQLEAQKAVAHDVRDRTFVFRALVKESEISRTAAQELLDRIFHGSISGLVAHLLESEDISPEEHDRLRKLIEASAKEKTK